MTAAQSAKAENDSIGTILFLLRRIFQLNDDATLQDIVDCLNALEQQPVTSLSALSPSLRPESDAQKISRLLNVTPEMMQRWAA
jgi:hypothetical protein